MTGNAYVLGVNTASLSLCQSQFSFGISWELNQASAPRSCLLTT